MTRYWCLVTSAENWQACKKNGLWGLEGGYFVTLDRYLREGDKAVVYSHGGLFVAVVEFLGRPFFSTEKLGWAKYGKETTFPYRIAFKTLHESKEPPHISYSTEDSGGKAVHARPGLIDDVVFIADKGRTWNQYLQVSVIRLSDEDFKTISEAVLKS